MSYPQDITETYRAVKRSLPCGLGFPAVHRNPSGGTRTGITMAMPRNSCASFIPVNILSSLQGSRCRNLHQRPELCAAVLGHDAASGRLAMAGAFGDIS